MLWQRATGLYFQNNRLFPFNDKLFLITENHTNSKLYEYDRYSNWWNLLKGDSPQQHRRISALACINNKVLCISTNGKVNEINMDTFEENTVTRFPDNLPNSRVLTAITHDNNVNIIAVTDQQSNYYHTFMTPTDSDLECYHYFDHEYQYVATMEQHVDWDWSYKLVADSDTNTLGIFYAIMQTK